MMFFLGRQMYPKFEVIKEPSQQFESLTKPKLVVKPDHTNVGLYTYRHTDKVRRPRALSSHLLPGVNIRPALGNKFKN